MCWRLGFSFGILLVSNLRSGTSIHTRKGAKHSHPTGRRKSKETLFINFLLSSHTYPFVPLAFASTDLDQSTISARRSPTTHATCLNPPLALIKWCKRHAVWLSSFSNTNKFGFGSLLLAPLDWRLLDGALPPCPGLLSGFPPSLASALWPTNYLALLLWESACLPN